MKPTPPWTKQQCPLLLQMKPPPAAEASKKQQKEAGKCENKERYKNLRHKIELTPLEHQSRPLQSKMPCQKHQAAAATATAAIQDECLVASFLAISSGVFVRSVAFTLRSNRYSCGHKQGSVDQRCTMDIRWSKRQKPIQSINQSNVPSSLYPKHPSPCHR